MSTFSEYKKVRDFIFDLETLPRDLAKDDVMRIVKAFRSEEETVKRQVKIIDRLYDELRQKQEPS